MARPRSNDTRQRRAHWLTLVADGADPVHAAQQARIDLGNALRIACRNDFQNVVKALREHGGTQTVVLDDQRQAAA